MKRSSAPRNAITILAFFGALLVITQLAIAWAQSGGGYDLRRNVVAGGGGTSTSAGGNLQVDGTAGQPAAGTPMSGGQYSQVGGFWQTIDGVATPTPSPLPGPGILQFSSAAYSSNEGCTAATITVARTNGSTGIVTVDYATSDGTALQRTDYTIGSGTLTFPEGVLSQVFTVLVCKDAYVEVNESVNLTLSNPSGGATLGTQTQATLTITNDGTVPPSQPIDDATTFVCQHYHDFLSREPDAGGLAFWTGLITSCGGDAACIRTRRIDVSNAFYYELEFQQTGSYVYRLYRESFGNNQPFPNPNPDPLNPNEEKKVPLYLPFMRDRAQVRGGPELPQLQLALAKVFVQRTEFLNRYPVSLDGAAFVDAVLATINNDMGANLTSQRPALINLYNSAGGGNAGRGNVMYRLADDNAGSNPINNRAFIDAEYNRAFVFTQYAGYLRRDADMAGFLFWLGQVNSAPIGDVSKQHAMVCAFMTSAEYQQRFSSVVTHSNGECP